jgi:hypothetical protein
MIIGSYTRRMSRLNASCPIALTCSLLVACSATPLTQSGSSVSIVTDAQRESCTFIGTVQGNSLAYSNDNLTGALNDARNKAATMGGNAIRILKTEFNQYREAYSTAEVLKCP